MVSGWMRVFLCTYFLCFKGSFSQEDFPYSPDYWLQSEASSYVRDSPPPGGPEGYLGSFEDRMDLSDRPKLSHGPRRTRSAHSFPNYYMDPQFKIPLAIPPPGSFQGEYFTKDFCSRVDCHIFPEHTCCGREEGNRRYDLEPSDSFLDDWVSYALSFWMENPHIIAFFKKLALGLLGLSILTGWMELGSVERARSDSSIDDLTHRIILALEPGEDSWMEELRDHVSKRGETFRDVNEFLCCFFGEEDNELKRRKRRRTSHYLSCRPSGTRSSITCVSDLLYNVTLNKET